MKIIDLNQRVRNINFESAFLEFQHYNKAKNLSERTINYYDDCYKYFSNFFDVKTPCYMVKKYTYEKYIEFLKENTKAGEISINTYLRGLRVILYYFMRLGYMEDFHITIPKATKEIKEPYTEYEIALLLKKPSLQKFSEYRDWVITNYLVRNRK